jgi:hypothetical protein
MLVRLSHPHTELPPLRNVELTRTQIAWLSLGPTETGDWLRVELYFHPTFREPVVLLAQVSNCVVQAPQEGYRIEAELVRMSEETCENLARLSFLTHRQQRRVRAAAARAT